jgi:ABC-2 type transport system ATP-binding protein
VALLDRLDAHAVSVERVTVHTADLDDVFFALTGHSHKGPDEGSDEGSDEGEDNRS